jgi:hypothetical protein
MHRADNFSMFVRRARDADPSDWIGVAQLAVRRVLD